jgi:arylsulfatase A-like enzyme
MGEAGLKRSLLLGATWGLLAWLAYGSVEFALANGIRLLWNPDVVFPGWQLYLIGQALAVYALAGLLLGAASGALLAWTGRDQARGVYSTAASLTLVLAFAVNLIPAWPIALPESIALGVAVLLAIGFAAALISKTWQERVAFASDPWVVSLLLLECPWVCLEIFSNRRSGFARIGISVLVLMVTAFLAILWRRLQSSRAGTMRMQTTTLSIVICLAGVLVMIPRRAPALPTNGPAQPAAGKPNIVLITMDTVRADHLPVYGYGRDTTPNLRIFARKATVYSRAIAAADFTLPSHASIFTSLYPGWHGAYHAPPDYPVGRPLGPGHVTLAESLRSHGYQTMATVANHAYLSPWVGLAKGFEVYDSSAPLLLLPSQRPFYLRQSARRILGLVTDADGFYGATLRAGDINRRAFALLDQAKNRGPFFLFLNFMDAHLYYTPPPPYNKRFGEGGAHPDPSEYRNVWLDVNSGKRGLSAAEAAHLESQYDGGIAAIDSEIGNLLARLRKLRLYENTVIIVTSDHGEAFGDHGLLEHALGSVYQEHIHVPLLIKYPGQHEARESDALASHVDLMPTVLDLAGIAPPAGAQGKTLRSPRSGETEAVYSEATTDPALDGLNPRFRGIRRAIFSDFSKLIVWTAGPSEFYDLAADPHETHNLSGDPRAAALANRFAEWLASMPRQLARPAKPDKSSVERLKSLGYAQ